MFFLCIQVLLNFSLMVNAQDAVQLYNTGDSLLANRDYSTADSFFIMTIEKIDRKTFKEYYVSAVIKRARIRYNLGNKDEANDLLARAYKAFEELGISYEDTLYSDYLSRKAYFLMTNNQYAESERLYEEAACIREKKQQFDYTLSLINNNLGFINFQMGDLVRASGYFATAISIREKIYGPGDSRLATPLSNLGAMQLSMGYLDEADKNLEKAMFIFEKTIIERSHKLGIVYINIGIISYKRGDYNKALNFLLQGLEVLKSDQSVNKSDLINAYDNLGLIYQALGMFDAAKTWFNNSIDFQLRYKPDNLAFTYNRMGTLSKETGNLMEAEGYYKTAIESIVSNYGEGHPKLSPAYLNLGIFYGEQKKISLGLNYLRKALGNSLQNFGPKHPKTSRCYYNIAWVYSLTGDLDSALLNVQRSLIANVDGFEDLRLRENPGTENSFSNLRLLASLKFKGELLLSAFNRDPAGISLLEAACSAFEAAMETVETIRFEYQNEESRLFLARNVRDVYLLAVQTAYMLYEITPDALYKNKVYEFTERGKSAALLAGIRGMEAMRFGGIPEGMQDMENGIRKEISYYKEQLFEEKKLQSPDTFRIRLFESRVFNLAHGYDSLIATFEKDFPEYYALKYKPGVPEPEAFRQQAGKRQLLLEYAISDSLITALLIGKDTFRIHQSRIDSGFFDALSVIYNILSGTSFTNSSREEFRLFVNNSARVYSFLIEPFEKEIRDHDLTIVPGEALAYLPFGILLTDTVNTGGMDYSRLPYLLRKNSIGYAYSATLLSEKKRGKTRGTKKLLGIAPEYLPIDAAVGPSRVSRQGYREKLHPLPYAKYEIEEVSRLTGGHTLMKKDASETNFRKLAPGYDVLHLAMHTVIDDNDPMFSKLAFSFDSGDSLNDGYLNVQEIYDLRLNARMTVLSACSSGAGKMHRGEGVMSIARSFMYAGCPGIIMTLWTVDDQSGGDIMSLYYGYLKKGCARDQALRKAKLEFLGSAGMLRSHPHFWSAYIPIGEKSPLYSGKNYKVLIYLIVLAGVLFWFFFRRKKSVRIS